MEKEPQPDSMSAVTIKPDYAPSEVYSSEPPPAYHKPQSSAVQIAKIVAATVILCSVILGGFLLASAYVTANASCRALEQELELLSEAADRFQSPIPQPEALIQDEPTQSKRHIDTDDATSTTKTAKEIEHNSIDSDSEQDSSSDSSDSSSDSSSESDEEDRTPIHIKLPLQLDLDDLAGAILDRNQKSKMNCIVEKKKAEELVDHQPKTISLPFGVNLTTNPRFERLSGERMVIICESGTFQRAEPQPRPQPEEEDNDDQEEDTIMIQPVMIPIPNTPFQTHMPQQMAPQVVQSIVAMVSPQQDDVRMPMRPPMRPPMHPMETMRPPMPPMMHQVPMQMQGPPPPPQNQQEPQQQNEFPPSPVLHHIIQQIIAQKIMESQRQREEQLRQMQMQQQQQRQDEQQHQMGTQQQTQESSDEETDEPRMPHRFQMPPQGIMQRLPIPEEVLTQLNRLPNRNVIVAVQESDSSEEAPATAQEMRFVQEPRQNAAEMNGRQAFAPVNIPVAMMPQHQEQQQQQQEQDSQEPQAAESEETRPHYVQPRSVRSVDNPFKEARRIKRCACDCAC